MPKEIEQISLKIASSRSFDGYSTWRILKTIDREIETLGSDNRPVPIELARLRSIIARARELRRRRHAPVQAASAPGEAAEQPVPAGRMDIFDVVERYRALGGRRLAVDLGQAVEIRQWDRDTPEASELWNAVWSAASHSEHEALASALLIRGRF